MDTQGDSFFAVFSSASACAAAAIEIQLALGVFLWPAGERIRVRMGVHSGEASATSTGLVGFDVHRAARVAGVAHGGQVVLSETAAALVRDSLAPGASLRELGLHRLKDLGRAQHLFQLEADGLQADFPALRSLEHPQLANNLPAQSASFIGREQELAQVRSLVESARLVTLTGAGGAGKTRLALHVAAELIDVYGDGVWLVELASVTDETVVASKISETFGIVARPGQSVVETLTDVLASQEMLIVLDNCEHLIESCAKVADGVLRRCPRARLLITSREPLGIGGESIYRVPSLSLPSLDATDGAALERSDAVALFAERARSQGVELEFDEDSAALIISTCRRLDGMPLAIELAAARLRSLSLASLHDLLDQRFRLLTGGSRSALERQQTLRATVDWSYSLLSVSEQSVLRRLSVFSEGFDLEAARAVCSFDGIEEFDVMEILGSLVDKSLVVTEPADGTLRYRLLETIRQFGAQRLVELDQLEAATASDRHCEYFLSLAEASEQHLLGPDAGAWFTRLDASHANLTRAIEYAAGDPDKTTVALRLAVALTYYWTTRSRRREAFGLLMPVLERPEAASADSRLYGRALVTAAAAALSVDMRTLRRLADQAFELGTHLNDERLVVSAEVMLCASHYFAGDPREAFTIAERCFERARPLGDDALLGETLIACLLCSQSVDPARAEELYVEAIAYEQRTGDLLLTVDVNNFVGLHALTAGDVRAAREHLERADRARRTIGAAVHHVSINMGLLLRAEGDLEAASSMLEDSVRASRRSGDGPCIAYSALGLACVAGDLADWDRAARLHGVAQSLLDEVGQQWQRYSELREASIETSRLALGEDEFRRLYAAGRELSSDAAVGFALGRSVPITPAR